VGNELAPDAEKQSFAPVGARNETTRKGWKIMEKVEDIEVHELATIEQNLRVDVARDVESSEGAVVSPESGFMSVSASGFMSVSASGFMSV
jgi:hypothetical protein